MPLQAKKKPRYTYGMLKEAYNDVKQKNHKIRYAARQHGLPESTLRYRLQHSKGVDVKMGGPTMFSRLQEEQLAEHCLYMAHIGYGYARWQILDIAKCMCEVKGKQVEPTKHWFYGFVNRFPEVSMVKPKKRERARDEAVTEDILKAYFDELRSTLEKYDLMNKPQQIWNIDETGISLDHNPPKVLARTGSSPFSVTTGRSPTTTVIAAGSALGETITPYIIYKGERVTKEMKHGGLLGTEYRTSPTGWSNSVLFLNFFKNHFLHHITTRPCIVFYDGHSTHITFEVIEAARKENIHLFVLPPHSSHCLQPLDVSVFSSFKSSLNAEFHKYLHEHPHSVIVKEQLAQFIAIAYRSSLTVSNIMSGFRKTGIFPFDPTAPSVSPPTLDKKSNEQPNSRKERKDNRTVKILFQDKENKFSELKADQVVKKKRKTFVPPYGAAVTEESYFQEKKRKQEEVQSKKARKTEILKKNEKTGTLNRKNHVFTPPFISDTQDNETSDRVITREKVTEIKTTKKGKCSNSRKGKNPCKKRKPLTVIQNTSRVSEDEEDDEVCCMCGKWQPDGLRLDLSIKFVSWGQCMTCKQWVHLKYCTSVEILADDEDFKCPRCSSEP